MRNSAMVSLVAFAGFAVWCSSLALGQAKITRPGVSESACPVQVIEVPTQEGRHTTAAIRKPPGKGPFPAAIYLHGTLQPRETKTLVHSLRDQTGSRFLAAGYVTVAATFRSRSNDPLTRDALEDCLAVVAHVKKIPEVDPQSVVLWGDSGGGSLVLELAGETSLCAVTACEPATVLFTGLYSRENLGGKPPYSAGSGVKIMEDPKAYFTPALQKLTREKIAKIACPVFIAHGDRHIINKVNNEVFVPEMKQAGKLTQIILYPGGGHSFSHGGKPELTEKFFNDCHAFFKKHLPTQPRALETSLLEQVPVNEQPRRAQPPQAKPPAVEGASKTSSARARELFRKSTAELMTMFDNPKFPDQLSALGGDKDNYRLPWDKAAENPRSWFGVTQVALHDGSDPPKPELTHLRSLLAGSESATLADVAGRYAAKMEAVLRAWAADKATDDDVLWLNALLRHGLLGNQCALSSRLDTLTRQYRQTEVELALPRVVPGMADSLNSVEQPVFIRGDCLRPGEPAPRRFLEVLSKPGDSFDTPGSGRLELAEQIASAENPLTARVMVNRIWHHLFGIGLVRTVDDFGHVGELPSHPELLDHLAGRFMVGGWSIKRLVRSLVLSRTFQSSSRPSPLAKEIDPQNRLLQHYPARRMEAEAIRDCLLAASGRLDRTMFGMSVQPFREKEYADRRLFPGPLDGYGRRSIYIKNNLMEAPRFLGAFNFPGGKVTQGRRDVTNVPAQALALLNDPFVLQQAEVWAQRLVARSGDSIGTRIETMFSDALGRPPTSGERERFSQSALELAELRQVPEDDVLKSQTVWQDVAHAMFNMQEFIYIP